MTNIQKKHEHDQILMISIKNIIKQKPCQKVCLFPIELQYPSSHQLLHGYPKTNPEKCNTISDKQND